MAWIIDRDDIAGNVIKLDDFAEFAKSLCCPPTENHHASWWFYCHFDRFDQGDHMLGIRNSHCCFIPKSSRFAFKGLLALIATIALLASSPFCRAAPVNGDFESGNTGFSSDYSFALHSSTPGTYSVAANPQIYNSALESFADHTSGLGLMMLVDGDSSSMKAWDEMISVVAHHNYTLTGWFRPTSSPNLASIQLGATSGGVTLGNSSIVTLTNGQWEQISLQFNTGKATYAQLAIRDENAKPLVLGNDFAIDDIKLTHAATGVPLPPAGWGAMSLIAGIALVKLVSRSIGKSRGWVTG